MTPQAVLVELLERLGAGADKTILINEEELTCWPEEAVAALKTQKLMIKAKPATSAICPGGERECVMPAHIFPAKENLSARAFIACDKRSDISRVTVSLAKLNQWQCSIDCVSKFIANSLELRQSNQRTDNFDLSKIGIVKGNKRSQMLCLEANGALSLVSGNSRLPLTELIEYHAGAYSLDVAMIRQLVDSATTADNRYTPSHDNTQAGYRCHV